MYIWSGLEGRFRVHTWYVLRGEGGFGGGMYGWKAVGGRFCVHTWYVQREKTGSGGSMCRVWAGRLVAGAGIAKSPTRPVLDELSKSAQAMPREPPWKNLSKRAGDAPGAALDDPQKRASDALDELSKNAQAMPREPPLKTSAKAQTIFREKPGMSRRKRMSKMSGSFFEQNP